MKERGRGGGEGGVENEKTKFPCRSALPANELTFSSTYGFCLSLDDVPLY